ncbi:MAG: tRNA pseudouridine(54/55) synthase Pus10 [Candidatus Thermoplasmatota archaeon]|nr:tRNA pseudouridine(54/55) synthase Pus10 [Candidatus Thermoplasmatota archaeon]
MNDIQDLFSNKLCMRCTGRIFASIDTGLTDYDRGQKLAFTYRAFFGEIDIPEKCYICNGIFSNLDMYLNMAVDAIGSMEYSTFLIGSKFDPDIMIQEQKIQNKYGNKGESIKKEFNREFGKYFSDHTGKEFSKNPDILIEINTVYDSVSLIVRPLYIYGTYLKKRRDIPQTRWINGTGNSIESLIGELLLKYTGGRNYKLHGSGREDVDVMMLGNGREFVMEVDEPVYRNINLEEFMNAVNRSDSGVYISNLEFSSKDKIREIKEAAYDKVYMATVECDDEISRDKMENTVNKFKNLVISQRTPTRVIGNRADLIRKKEIKYINIEDIHDKEATIKICSQSGTYIKELINGDNGRTVPSMSSIYGKELRVKSLDVIKIMR